MKIWKFILLTPVIAFVACAIAITAVGLNDRLRPADAIVVLGNTVMADGQPSPRLKARLDAALDAYRQKLAPLLIVSGGVGKEGFDEAAVMAQYLVAHGVAPTAVLLDSAGHDTAASATSVAVIARARNLTSVLVASQYFHLPRASLALTRAGVPVAGTIHARYVEARDVYSLAREVIGFAAYLIGLKGSEPVQTEPVRPVS